MQQSQEGQCPTPLQTTSPDFFFFFLKFPLRLAFQPQDWLWDVYGAVRPAASFPVQELTRGLVWGPRTKFPLIYVFPGFCIKLYRKQFYLSNVAGSNVAGYRNEGQMYLAGCKTDGGQGGTYFAVFLDAFESGK